MSSKLIQEINKDINICNIMIRDIQKKALQLEEEIIRLENEKIEKNK
jgi:hypothetical protein